MQRKTFSFKVKNLKNHDLKLQKRLTAAVGELDGELVGLVVGTGDGG